MILSNVLLTFRRNRNKGNDHLSFSPVSTQFFHPFIKHRPSPPEANQLGILPPTLGKDRTAISKLFPTLPQSAKRLQIYQQSKFHSINFLVKFVISG